MVVSNLTDVVGKDVYTKNAKYIGKINDAMLDTERGSIYGVVIQMARESFLSQMLEKGGDSKKAILIPHRHILAVEDIVLITVPEKYEVGPVHEEPAPAAPEPEPEPEI